MNVSNERLLDLALDWMVNLWDPYPCRAMKNDDPYCLARKERNECSLIPDRECWIHYLTKDEE